MSSPTDAFWSYAVGLYDRAQATCLRLQDACGFDVNLLLFCCWAGGLGMRFEGKDMVRLIAAIDPLRKEAITPLRHARRWLKGQGEAVDGAEITALREDILALEIAAERIAQGRILTAAGLTSLPAPPPDTGPDTGPDAGYEAAAFLLSCYAEAAGVARTDLTRSLFTDLLAEAFPDPASRDQ